MDKICTFAFLLLAALFCAAKFTGCNATYATGVRSGTVTKISTKGLIFKSCEGELLLASGVSSTNTNGQQVIGSQVFEFSASPDVVEELGRLSLSGERVTLHYRQWWIGPMTQDTRYTVHKIDTAKP